MNVGYFHRRTYGSCRVICGARREECGKLKACYISHDNSTLAFLSGLAPKKPCLLLILSLALFTALAVGAEAIPVFAKKYSAPCSLCHSSWPKLNKVGWQFKWNGYQMPDSRDGSKVGKLSPAPDLHLDIGNANPPLSFRFRGGMDIFSPPTDPDGSSRAGDLACC